MKVSKAMRGRRGAKRVDLDPLRDAMKDRRKWVEIGVVTAPEDGGAHWAVAGENSDVHIEVEIQLTREVLTCRLAAGVFVVPALGEEVVVLLPTGVMEFQPSVIAVLASSVPTTQGPAPNRIVIVRDEVLVHAGAGGAVPLALKSDVERIETAIAGATITPADGGATFKATILGGLATSLHGPSGGATWPVGTTVLKGA